MTASHRRLLHGVSVLALAGIGVFAVSPTPATAEQWLGTVSSDWYDPANWNTGVPAGAFDVLVNSTTPHAPVIDRGTIDLRGKAVAVGTTADGAMTITGGASLTSGQSTITAEPQSTGTVTVTGAGSTWNTDFLVVGYESQAATMRVENGGLVRSSTATIARNGGVGLVEVDGIGSRWEIGDIDAYFGAFGRAEVVIGNGGVVANGGRVHLGNEAAASGTVTVDGAGSRWEIGEHLIIGLMGSGSVAVTDGGYVEADIVTLGSHTAGNVSSLVLDGQGSELRAPGGIQVGFTTEPVMRITGGAKLSTGKTDANPFIGRSYVGYLQSRGEAASVLISGEGSVWEDANYIIMGNSYSDATITVEDGGALKGTSIDVGRGRGIDATNPDDPFYQESYLLVSGTGTTAEFDWLSVGNAGAKGTADISAGAVVTTGRTLLGGGGTAQGDIMAVSDVDLVLTGAGTRWATTLAGEDSFASDRGRSRILVSDGARLDVAGDMRFGGRDDSEMDIAELSMTVERSGIVRTGGDALLGRVGNSVAVATIDGAGSAWTVDGQMVVGAGGAGTLRAVDGGRIAAAGIEIARDAGSSGKLIIGGETAAAAAGVVNAPTIAFGAGDGELIFNHTGDITVSAALSGNGEVRQQAGRTNLSGDSSGFSGTTYVGGGMLWVSNHLGGRMKVGDGSTNTEFAVGGDGNVDGTSIGVTRNAFATFHSGSSARGAAITSSGTVNVHSGADMAEARLAAAAGGQFTIHFDPFGTETHSFGSIGGAGSFRLAGIGGDDVFEVGSDDRSTTVSGAITEDFDSVALRKVGNGALTLSGINTYTGATDIDGGVLNVAGSLVSVVDVNAGGALAGIGTIGGLTVNSGGTLAPGNSIGTMTVIGDARFGAGSTYEVEIAADGGSDLLAVGGTASLAGTLSVLGIAYPTGYADARSYTILTADGGVTGTFDQVTDDLPDVDVTATYNANDVVIGYDKTTGATSQKEIYPNSLQAGLGAGRLFAGTLQRRGQLHGLGGPTLGGVAPLGYGPAEGGSRSTDAGSTAYGVAAWASAIGLSQDVDANGGVAGYDAGTYGLASGVDSTFDLGSARGRAGIALGYTRTDVDVDTSSADIDAWHVGVYGGVENGPFAVSGALSYAWQDYGFSRFVPFIGGGGTTAAGEADGNLFAASLEASYDIAAPMGIRQDIGLRFAPTVSLDYVRASRDGFTETGAGVLDMTVDSDDISRTWLGAGIAMSARFVGEGGLVFTPQLQLMYQRNVGDDRAVTSSVIAPAGATFTTPGVLEDDDFLGVGAGLGIGFTERASLDLRYDGAFGSNTRSHSGHVGLSIRF